MEQGMLFDITHGSFVDGPGIRTTVFFKGCNLKCRWCHNPESQSAARQMLFYKNKCTSCGICKAVCPSPDACTLCGACTQYCPSAAKKVCGKLWTAEDVMAEISRDEAFYKSSKGGVTFSGGECMLQVDFLRTLLQRCRERGIHTAVDTAGNVAWDSFEKIIPYTDVFLYDVKCFSSERHRVGTGVSNERIMDNLKNLSVCFGGDIIVRIPIIPGFNTDAAELEKMADFLRTVNVKSVELLPYHKLGENKYAALGMDAELYSVPAKEEMAKIETLFKR